MKTALTIAGSDCSGGAGIQADIKTMTMNGVYAMSVITSITAQNTMGVTGILDISCDIVEKELDAVFTDIYPDAIKIGMVSSVDIINTIYEKLLEYKAENIVLDPVMVSTSGSKLIKQDAIDLLINRLIPVANLITPNIPEAEILSDIKILTAQDMLKAAEKISKKCSCAVLLKGGHSINDANDLLYRGEDYKWFTGERINNPNTHGTGCTLSSAIASNLAKGFDLDESVKRSKEYICGALKAMLDLGKGSGPMMHNFNLQGEFGKTNL